MERLTVTIDEDLVAEVDGFMGSMDTPTARKHFVISCEAAGDTW
jgi:metal-responsive CopG/Arc/MetJ family transcriptional regulator